MDKLSLSYKHFERLPLVTPVDRLAYIAHCCTDLRVLDLGCLDETALVKQDTEHWLHSRIASVATEVLGLDVSAKVPRQGLKTSLNAKIFYGDATNPSPELTGDFAPEIIVAGEFIEHIPNPSEFLANIKAHYSGKRLIVSTPNGCSIANAALGIFQREVQHPDHLHNFTFKTLNTMCIRAGFSRWKIIPYRFFATEMILTSRGALRIAALVAEKMIRLLERAFPALSFGYIIEIDI